MTHTKQILDPDFALIDFTQVCEILGYTNNQSIHAMKFHWCIEQGGAWWGTYDNDELIALSGIHPFKDGYRALFRGVQLYPRSIGLNRYHMQSHGFYDQLPMQIEYADDKPIYITTNTVNDASGKMTRVNESFKILARYNIVSLVGTETIFNAEQNVWLLDPDIYFKYRNK